MGFVSHHHIEQIGDPKFVSCVIRVSTFDGIPVSGDQTVTILDNTGTVYQQFQYTGPVSVALPYGESFTISVDDRSGYTTPTAMSVVASAPVFAEFVYQKISVVRFGFRRDKNNSDPDTRIDYLFDAVGKDPLYYDFTNDEVHWGDWKDFVYDVATPMMLNRDGTEAYELDPEDQTKKKDGTPSDISNAAFDGNAMVRFKKYKWVKRYQDDQYEYVIFSNEQFDDTYHAYAHTNENGNVMDAFYWGMFSGYLDDSLKMRSLSDKAIKIGLDAVYERDYCVANGDGHYTIYKSGWDYICDLLTLVSKSDNSQAKFGNGISDASGILSTGQTTASGPFTGSTSSGSRNVKTFWIEGFWGNTYQRLAGFVLRDNTVMVKMTHPYNFDGAGYFNSGIILNTESLSVGYISKASVTDECGFIPMEPKNGSGTTYYTDQCFTSKSKPNAYALVGGIYSRGLGNGPRLVGINNEYSSIGSICARISYLPKTRDN